METYLEEMRDVIENGPGLDVVPEVLDLVVVDSVEEEGERLEVHQGGHHPVDAEDLGTRVARYLEYPVANMATLPAQCHSF